MLATHRPMGATITLDAKTLKASERAVELWSKSFSIMLACYDNDRHNTGLQPTALVAIMERRG